MPSRGTVTFEKVTVLPAPPPMLPFAELGFEYAAVVHAGRRSAEGVKFLLRFNSNTGRRELNPGRMKAGKAGERSSFGQSAYGWTFDCCRSPGASRVWAVRFLVDGVVMRKAVIPGLKVETWAPGQERSRYHGGITTCGAV